MFKPSDLERMPKKLENIYALLENRIMSDVVRRIKINSDMTRSADWQIYRVSQLGESQATIKKMLDEALKQSNINVNDIYKNVIADGYAEDVSLYKSMGHKLIPFKDNKQLQQQIKAIIKQTNSEFRNITQSLGFAKLRNGKTIFADLAKFYQDTLDNAMLDLTTGTFDYDRVIKRTVSQMTTSGLRSVDYATGSSSRVYNAVRRALMTGVTQITGHINEENAKLLDTDYFEVSWHGTARPEHQVWQGKVFSHDDLIKVCGLGTVTGLGGANCRHSWTPFIMGVSERTYTDEQLVDMNARENKLRTYQGKEYTSYEALQEQRKLESVMRKQRQDIRLLKEAEVDEDEIINQKSRYQQTMRRYNDFSKKMNLPQEMQRVYVNSD